MMQHFAETIRRVEGLTIVSKNPGMWKKGKRPSTAHCYSREA
jgi:hypothetical protein